MGCLHNTTFSCQSSGAMDEGNPVGVGISVMFSCVQDIS